MSQIQLQENSCTYTANVIGTQLLFSIPDASSQPSGDDEVTVLDGGVQYIPLYVQEALPNNVVSSYVIDDSQQLPLIDQTRQIILTNDQIVALSQVSAAAVQQNGLPNSFLSLNDAENTSNGLLEADKTVIAEAAIIVEKDDIAHATNAAQVDIVDNDLVDPPDKTCPQACDTCGLRFESRKLFKKHVLSHLHDKPYKCPHCSESFNHEYNFIPHLATHNEKDPYCPVCNKSFNRLAGLKAHILIHQCDDTLPCPECLEEFSTQKLLDAHRLEHKAGFVKQLNRIHSCPHCEEKFSALAFLKEHVQDFHKVRVPKKVKKGKGGYVCEFCKKRFKKPSQLVRHRRTHTGEKPFECAECGKGFGQKGSLQIHMLKHSGLRPYACTYCSSQFSQKGNLQAHITRIHPEESKKSTCKYCSASFRNTQGLDNHMSRFHGFIVTAKTDKDVTYEVSSSELPATVSPPNSDSSNKENEVKGYETAEAIMNENPSENSGESVTKIMTLEVVNKCKYCSEIFQKRTDLVKHLKCHAGDKKYKCICSRQFFTKATMMNHFRAAHLESLEFQCDVCPGKFASEEDLKSHKQLKHKASFECTQCCLTFDSLKESELHKEAHNSITTKLGPSNIDSPSSSLAVISEMPFEFAKLLISSDGTIQFIREVPIEEEKEPANELIVSSSNEEIEMENSAAQDVIEESTREMSDDKQKHKCDHCNSAFRQKSHWKMHLRIHTGEKPFACENCDKSFVSKSALTVHLGTHNEVPAFKCDDCGRRFSSHRSLKRHMDLHVPGFTYSCSVCNRAYKTKVAWQKHLATHMKISKEKDSSNNCKKQKDKSLPRIVSDETNNVAITSVLSLQVANVDGEDGERPKKDGPTFNGDWSTLIQTLQPGHELNFEASEGLQFSTSTVMLPTDKTTSTVDTEPQTSSSDVLRQVQFNDFGNKMQLFTSLNDESFDGCVFLQNSEEDLQAPCETLEDSLEPQTTSNTHRCSLCNDSFDSLVELSIHKTTHLQDKWTTCANCNTSFGSSQQLQEHKKNCSVERTSNIEVQDIPGAASNEEYIPPSKLHKCTKCNEYYNVEDYLAHMSQNHKTVACNTCTKSSTHVQTPLVEDVPEKKPPNSSRERLEMKRKKAAWKRQTIRSLTEEEKLTVIKENPNSISEKILHQSILRQQVAQDKETPKETEAPEYPNQCKYCPKSFRKPSDLVRHLRVHTGERPYMCTSCNKSFSIKSTAKSHIKIHKKERLYKCHICHNYFAAIGSLKVHMRLHIGAKPFGCELCPARFRTSGHRKSHMFSHQRKENLNKEKSELKAISLKLESATDGASTKTLSLPNSYSFPYQQLLTNKLSERTLLNSSDKVSSDGLDSVKKSGSNNFLFALEGSALSYGEQLVESSSANQQFFLKEIKGDDETGTAAHFVVTMGDDINYQDNINDLLESVPHLNGEHDERFKLDLDIVVNKQQLAGDVCETVSEREKKFSSVHELKKGPLVDNILSCNVCKQNFRSKTDLEVHVLVHELDQLSCHTCSLEFPDETALRKHKCANEVPDMKSMPTTSLDLTSVVNDFFSFPAL